MKTASLAIFILHCHEDDLVIRITEYALGTDRVLADCDRVDQKFLHRSNMLSIMFDHCKDAM